MSGRAVAQRAGGAAILAVPILLVVAPCIEASALKRLWTGFELRDFRESPYGRLVILEAGGMRSIYDNGSLLANIPDPAAAEESVHYALLEHPAPETVLLIGGGVAGSIAEALRHPTVERLDDVEIDPTLIEMIRRRFPHEFPPISDRRLHVHVTDGRAYLQTANSRFDVIVANVPDPANAQLNRFYTTEFFRSAREHLAPGGVFAFQVHASEEYISPELAAFLRCVNGALQEVFAQVVVIPGDSFHFFAAAQPSVLTSDPQVLISRLKSRNLHTAYVREYFIPFRMMPDRMAQAANLLQSQQRIPANHDFHPAAYYFSIVLWSVQFSRPYARLLETAQQLPPSALIGGVGAILAALVWLFTWSGSPPKLRRSTAIWCVTATGYTLMTLQILVLLVFQALFGYLYHELALLIGMFMAGIATGSWIGILHARRRTRKFLLRATAINQSLLAIAAPVLLALVILAQRNYHGGALAATQAMFPVLAFMVAIPGGHQFPIASAIHLECASARRSLAKLYSVDLLGGCAAALILTGFLIPLYGFWNVAWLTAVINGSGAALTMATSRKSDITILKLAGHAPGMPTR